jgi:DNA-binding transcriptional LysR family regulator
MELRHLQSFMVVAEEKSFTRAALRLHIAQPPLSQRIQELERELDVRLFDRSTRKVELTEPGRVFLKHIGPLLQGVHTAVEACQRAQRGELGRLRLGYTGRASQAQLPGLLNRFRQAYPDVTPDILGPLPTGALRLKLLEHELDAILCFLPLSGPGIASQVFTESEFAIALPAFHPLASAETLSLSQLEGEAFVAYPSGQGFHLRQMMATICMDAGFIPRVVRESEASQTLLCLIASGLGIGLIPEEIQSLNIEGVVYRRLPPGTRRIQHGLAWLEGNTNPVLQKLVTISAEV